jgi:hypothetical protein
MEQKIELLMKYYDVKIKNLEDILAAHSSDFVKLVLTYEIKSLKEHKQYAQELFEYHKCDNCDGTCGHDHSKSSGPSGFGC